MLVCDVMTPDPVTVEPEDDLQTAQNRMLEAGCRRLPVVDKSGRGCGIITDRDLRLAANSPLILRERWQDDLLMQNTSVDACMTPDPYTIAPTAPLDQAVELILAHRIGGLPVVDGGKLVGVISTTDLLHALRQMLRPGAILPES